jgi:XTP/dITP diphosphohydrolase
MDVVLATSNPGKAREARAILDGSALAVVTLPMWLGEIETGTTLLENARIKAWSASRFVHADVLAEDAGIEVDALNGLPGVHSARFAGPGATPAQNNAKLLRLLDGVPAEKRTARYRIVAVLRLRSGEEIVGEGMWEGSVIDAPRGDGGFGYDPLFVPDGRSLTVAELSPDEKNGISHRAQALREIATRIGER